ncbi:MAG: hypothetical protein LQ338_006260 [Usnochroma carphineum]|nr:MAG: hypothetical protein LQ338_006260 [Usnochroma carphineum]
MYQTPTSKKTTSTSKSKAFSSVSRAEQILDVYGIYIDREKPMPTELKTLVAGLQSPRGIDLTPNSKFVKESHEVTKELKEDMSLHTLADKITYRPKMFAEDVEGEDLIWRGRSDQWDDRVPRPADQENHEALHAAMNELGSPPRPKPDISFGYSNMAFDKGDRLRLLGLPKDLHVYNDKPWFPYLLVEWKSSLESQRKAEQQARRDAAAAIDTIHRFFLHAQPRSNPSPALTCIFSLCVHYRTFEYRIHWRRVGDDGGVCYEADIIAEARMNKVQEVFEARGVILKTLDWVRGQRLTAIQGALKASKGAPPSLPNFSRYLRLVLPSQDSSGPSVQESVASWLSQTEDPSPPRTLKRKRSVSSLPELTKPLWAGDIETDMSDMGPPPSPFAVPVIANPSTPVSSSRSDRSPIKADPGNASWARACMANHGLLFDDEDAPERCGGLKTKVDEILGWELSLPPNEESVKAYKFRQKAYRTANERTWIRQLMPLLVKDPFPVSVPGNKDPSEPKQYTTETWASHGLIVTTETDFRRTTLPNGYIDMGFDEELAKALAKEDGLTNPRPDECYGFAPKHFAQPDYPPWTTETMALQEIAPLMHHPFLVVEGKGASGNPIDAENQAQRDGACLVTAARLLFDDMGEPGGIGADLRTIVFSATLGVDSCKVWVHWAEVGEHNTKIHMNQVRSTSLDDFDALAKIRGHLHNILRWGLVARLPELKTFHNMLRAYEPKHWTDLQAKHKKEQEEQANKKRKK